jgi:hypothetical protein
VILLASLALLFGPASTPVAASPPAASSSSSCSPCAYSARSHRRARRAIRRAHLELERAHWYLRRHRATRPYRAWLARTRACETRGQAAPYRTNTGNGYWGAYQFDVPTWASVGGRGLPSLAPPLEQDYRAVVLLQRRGTAPWPVCGRA